MNYERNFKQSSYFVRHSAAKYLLIIINKGIC